MEFHQKKAAELSSKSQHSTLCHPEILWHFPTMPWVLGMADSQCTVPCNTSSLRHVLLLSLHRECHTVNVPGEQHKGLRHF